MFGVKGFNKGMTCRGLQYKEWETFECDGPPELCKHGYHFCTLPVSCFDYYPPNKSVYADVESVGDVVISVHDDSVAFPLSADEADHKYFSDEHTRRPAEFSKVCTNKLKIKRKLTVYELCDEMRMPKLYRHVHAVTCTNEQQMEAYSHDAGTMFDVAGPVVFTAHDYCCTVLSHAGSAIVAHTDSFAQTNSRFRIAAALRRTSAAMGNQQYTCAVAAGENSIAAVTGSCSVAVALGGASRVYGQGDEDVLVGISPGTTIESHGHESIAIGMGDVESDGYNSVIVLNKNTPYGAVVKSNRRAVVVFHAPGELFDVNGKWVMLRFGDNADLTCGTAYMYCELQLIYVKKHPEEFRGAEEHIKHLAAEVAWQRERQRMFEE